MFRILFSVPAPCPSGLREAKVGHSATSSQTDCSGRPGPLRMVSSPSFLFLRSAQALQPKEETWKGSSHGSSPLRVMVGEGAFRDAGRMLFQSHLAPAGSASFVIAILVPPPPHYSYRFSRLGITFFFDANQDLRGKYTWGEGPTCSHPEALVQRVLRVR